MRRSAGGNRTTAGDSLSLAGLTPARMRVLLRDRWDGSSVTVLNDDLPAELFDKQPARVVLNARSLLRLLDDGGPVKLTPAGNLPRAAVGKLLDHWHFRPGDREEMEAVCKVINEHDVPWLFEIRDLLRHLGLLRPYRGSLRLTPAGRESLAPEATGRLAVRLFRAHFRELRFAPVFDDVDPAQMQADVPKLLWIMHIFPHAWWSCEALAIRVRPDRTPLEDSDAFDRFVIDFRYSLLEPLVDFGLLDQRTLPDRNSEYRPSRLYERFITWRIPRPWPTRDRWEHPLDHFTAAPVFGELSPAAAAAILRDPLDGTGPLRIASDLTRDAFEAPTLGADNARRLLWLLDGDGSWTVDAYDQLSPDVIARVARLLEWWPGSEDDAGEPADTPFPEPGAIWVTRRDLTTAGLIRHEGYRLEVTDAGRRLIDPGRAGELAAHLLRAELADPGYEAESLNDGLDINRLVRRRKKLLLWRLSRLDEAWRDGAELVDLLTLPEMMEEIEQYPGGKGYLGFIISAMVLNRFCDLGLLERDLDTVPERPRYRKTSLLDRMLAWRV